MSDRDIKWAFIITIIKLFEPKDVTYEITNGGVYRHSKFIGLCEWARNE